MTAWQIFAILEEFTPAEENKPEPPSMDEHEAAIARFA